MLWRVLHAGLLRTNSTLVRCERRVPGVSPACCQRAQVTCKPPEVGEWGLQRSERRADRGDDPPQALLGRWPCAPQILRVRRVPYTCLPGCLTLIAAA